MAIDGCKSCRSSKYRIKHTLHVYSIFIMDNYGSRGVMVSVLSLWFLHPGFDPRRAQFYFSKNKLTERSLKCACHWVNWMVTEWWLKCDWNPPFPSPFSRHSATIQSPFSRLKGEISSCVFWFVIFLHSDD